MLFDRSPFPALLSTKCQLIRNMTPNILRAIAAPTPPGQLLFNSFRVPRYGRFPLIFKPQTRNLIIHEYQAQGLLAKVLQYPKP